MARTFGAFDIPYPIKREDMASLHINFEDTKILVYGTRHILVYMVPNDNPLTFENCRKELMNDLRNEARDSRCRIQDESGHFHRCTGCCRECTKEYHDSIVSLDQLNESHKFQSTPVEDKGFQDVENELTLDSILKEVGKQNPRYEYLLRRVLNGESGRGIAKSLGMSAGTINEQIERAIKLATKIWKNS